MSDDDYDALWAYLVEGGPENAANFLAYAARDARRQRAPRARPTAAARRCLLARRRAWPISTPPRADWTDGRPGRAASSSTAPWSQGAGLDPIDRLTKALLRRGLNPLPVFVASLKDPVSAATLDAASSPTPRPR